MASLTVSSSSSRGLVLQQREASTCGGEKTIPCQHFPNCRFGNAVGTCTLTDPTASTVWTTRSALDRRRRQPRHSIRRPNTAAPPSPGRDVHPLGVLPSAAPTPSRLPRPRPRAHGTATATAASHPGSQRYFDERRHYGRPSPYPPSSPIPQSPTSALACSPTCGARLFIWPLEMMVCISPN
jgi:hypothetical protein